MGIVNVSNKGAFEKTKKFFDKVGDIKTLYKRTSIDAIAEEGKRLLMSNTPVDTGKTASSWDYTIEKKNGKITVNWTNDNVVNGVNIAIILQYGHATKNGGYVAGRDYINPAIRPIFDKMTSEMWKVVISL